MLNICGGVGTGKTRKLVALAEIKGATIVCKNPDAMLDKIHNYGYIGINCMSYAEFIKEHLNNDGKNKFVIDDVEGLLGFMNGSIIGFTSNTDDD